MATGAIVAAAMVGGTILSAVGQVKAARAKRQQAEAFAELKRDQAIEILNRSEMNAKEVFKQGTAIKGRQIGAFAKGGVALKGTALLVLQDTANKVAAKQRNIRYAAEWEATKLEREAGIESRFGVQLEKAGRIQAAGTILGGGARAFAAGSELGFT